MHLSYWTHSNFLPAYATSFLYHSLHSGHKNKEPPVPQNACCSCTPNISIKAEDLTLPHVLELLLQKSNIGKNLGTTWTYVICKFTYLSLAESWLAPSLDFATRALATVVLEVLFCPDVPAGGPFTRTIFSFGFFSLFWNYTINFMACYHEHNTSFT